MSIINLIQVSHDFGNKLLFDNINLTFDNNTKAGLIGRNGTGKTTLFKIMTGQIKPYKGNVSVAKGYKIGYFSQDYNFSSKETLWDWLYKSREDLMHVRMELQKTNDELKLPSEEKIKKLDKLQTEYEVLGGFLFENDIKSLLNTFGFKEPDYERSIDDFSGGEKTRIRLISILLNKYNFILFDEPTNHLDLLTVDWFIQYLKGLDCGYLIVSHDRYLLDQVANRIYNLNNKRIDTYNGNYSSFEIQAQERETVLQRQYAQQQKLIKKTEDFIQRNIVRDSTSSRAKSRLKMLNRLERIELDTKNKDLRLNIDTAKRSGNDIFRMNDLRIGYKENSIDSEKKSEIDIEKTFKEKILVKNINLNLHYQEKICLVGANGSGKTTLLKILNGELEPLGGELWTGYNLTVGYYDQNHIDLDEELTVLETIWNLVPSENYGYVMSYLSKFGYDEDQVEQKVFSLSGGEKSRLYLAQLIHEKPNLLILDEPTNHLDINMIKSLEKALKNYDGTLILVSHDRYFIKAITDDYWIIKEGSINHCKDSFENIMEKINPFEKEKKNKIKTVPVEIVEKKAKKINPYILNKLLDSIKELEKNISSKEDEILDIQHKFSDSEFYSDKGNIDKANKRIADLRIEILELSGKKDELETEYLLSME
ncbi:MAG: ABC-F family ATP-binding cassette domain-containing protein [Candidatus Cloacimonetes bacterium]|nr:ABC-F family ATP-binding cassette domain-containing protein [Candidatus Cloacimonadota bacterium]